MDYDSVIAKFSLSALIVAGVRPVTITRAPSLMNNLAVAKPKPVVPPVMCAVFPLNLSMLSPVFICLEAPTYLRVR